MTSIAESSDQNHFFTELAALSTKDQMLHKLRSASKLDKIDLLTYLSKKNFSCDGETYQKIKTATIKEITYIMTNPMLLTGYMLHEIVSIGKILLLEEDPASKTYGRLLHITIDKTSCAERLGLALNDKDQNLLDHCIEYLRVILDLNVTCIDFQYLIIRDFNVNNENSFPFMEQLVKCIPSTVKITVKIDTMPKKTNESGLISFVESYGQYLETLLLSENNLVHDSGLPIDEILEKIFSKCPHLRSLTLDWILLTGAGLNNILLCTELGNFDIVCCPNLIVFPDLLNLTELKTYSISFSPAISDEERIKTFLAFYEKNRERALKIFKSFKIQDTASIEKKIKEDDLDLYLRNFSLFHSCHASEGVAILNELHKNDPQLAIKYLYKLSGTGKLIIEDKETFIGAVETYCLPGDADKALFIAIGLDEVALARKAIVAGADVSYLQNAPLLRACKFSGSEMVELLLNNHADAKFAGGTLQHETPLSVARVRANLTPKCFALLTERDGGFTDEVFALKLLAHEFSDMGLKTIKFNVYGQDISPEGFTPGPVVDHYMDKAPTIYEELIGEIAQGRIPDTFSKANQDLLKSVSADKELREKFLNAIDMVQSSIKYSTDFSHMDIGLFKDALLVHLRSGKPLACFGSSDVNKNIKTHVHALHAWGLVISKVPGRKKYRVYLCDRRGGTTAKGGICVTDVDEDKMFEIIQIFQDLTKWKTASESEAELRENFTADKIIKQKVQEAGNCCYYSLQAIEFALLISLLIPIVGYVEAFSLAREIKRYRTSKMRYNHLKEYLDTHLAIDTPYPANWFFVDNTFNKCRGKPKLAQYHKLMVDFILQNASMQHVSHALIDNAIDKYGEEGIELYVRVKSAITEDEKIAAISNLIQEKPDLFLFMIDFMPIEREQLYLLVLRLNPSIFIKCLKELRYTHMEAVLICMSHHVNPINLTPYEKEDSRAIACQLINEIKGIEDYCIITKAPDSYSENDILLALKRGLRHTIDLELTNVAQADTRTIQNLARYCPFLKTLKIISCNNIDLNALSLSTCFPHLERLELQFYPGKPGIKLSSLPKIKACFPNLTSLVIHAYDKIGGRFIKALSVAYPHLESLEIFGCAKARFIKSRSLSIRFPRLTHLNLIGCRKIDSESIQAFSVYCPNLIFLGLEGNKMDSKALEDLARACPSLERLKIGDLQLDPKSVEILSTRFSKLRSLTFFELTGLNVETVRHFQRNETLRDLVFLDPDSVEIEVLNLLAIACPNLRSLNLSNWRRSEKVDLMALSTGFTHLETLTFSMFKKMGSETFAAFRTFCPNLTKISFRVSDFGPNCLSELAKGCPNLASLGLTFGGYVVDSCAQEPPICFPNVTELNLSRMLRSNELLLASYCPNLLDLTITGPTLTPSFFEELAKTCPKLSVLNLSESKCIDADLLRAIAKHFPGLMRLNLGRTNVNLDGLQVLAKDFQNLEMLNLGKCEEICSSDLQVFAKGLSALRELVLETCLYVDQPAIDALKSSRPQLVVTH